MTTEDQEQFRAKFDKLWEAYQEFTDSYEKKEPNWIAITVLEIVRNALYSLRRYIQDPDARDISWDRPWAELQYAIEWNWKHNKGQGAALFGEFTEEDQKTPETIVSKMKEVFQKHKQLFVFDLLTHHAAFLTGEGIHDFILPVKVKTELDQLGHKEGMERLSEIYKPFSFGTIDEESPLLDSIDGMSQEKPHPSLRFTIKDDAGRLVVDVHIVVEIHPLVVNQDERRAYYPVIVGLSFIDSTDGLVPDTAAWTVEAQETLWNELDKSIDQEIGTLSRYTKLPFQSNQDPVTSVALASPAPAVVPPTEMIFPLPFGHAIADQETLDFIRHIHKVRLPAKKWSTLPSWKKLKAAEVERILAERGERAFSNPGRGALLKRRPKNPDVIELTAEAERNLKIREGLKRGYRFFNRADIKEYFVRLFQVGSGYLEVGLSWYGIAGPWVEEWRRDLQKTADRLENSQRDLPFDDLDEDRKEEIDRLIRWAQILEDGRKVMEMVLGQVSRQSQNPIRIPALVLKNLLRLENDPNWKVRVDGGLNALLACSFMVKSFQMEQVKAYGNFLGEWQYNGAGAGDHGEGDYLLDVQPSFLGCLSVFQSNRRRLDSKHEVTYYDFGKKLTSEIKESQNWGRKARAAGLKAKRTFSEFDAGRVFYNAAERLSPERQNLVAFLEAEITLRRDHVSRFLGNYEIRKSSRTRPTASDTKKPRLYGNAECPLLQEGKHYQGALGHFRANPETGRSLYGSVRRSSATGGPHSEGLISVLGYYLPSGAAHRERGRVVRQTLEDIKAVVVDYLGGVAAARGRDKVWFSLEEAAKLGEQDLGKRIKWFFFLPDTWHHDRKRRWETVQKERAARGETPHAWIVTEDKAEAERARAFLAEKGPIPQPERTETTGFVLLRHKLRAARVDRKLRLEDVGKIFGVSKVTVLKWETGTEPDDDGKIRGKPIAQELVPMIERWIQIGQRPTPEELAARKTRRLGVNPKTGKPTKK